MGCGDEKLSKYLTQTFTAHCNAMICQQVTLSGDAEWPKVADAVIEAVKRDACQDMFGPVVQRDGHTVSLLEHTRIVVHEAAWRQGNHTMWLLLLTYKAFEYQSSL